MLPTSFHDIAAMREVSLPTWHALLRVAGESARLTNAGSYDDLWQSLTMHEPEAVLLDALAVLDELGSDLGRERLLDVANDDQAVDLATSDDEPVRELVARVWVESHSNAGLAMVLQRARVSMLDQSRERAFHEFVGERSCPTKSLAAASLRTRVIAWCRAQGKSEVVEVYAYERNGVWCCEVLRGEPMRRVIEIRDQHPEVLNFRPAAADHLRYEPESARLTVATRSPRMLRMYRAAIGEMLAGNDDFFSSDNVCSLKQLQKHGSALFQRHRRPEIVRVDVVALRWRRGDRDRIEVHGADCFQLLDDLGARLVEGELIEARLALWFAGQRKRGTVVIKVPGRIEINAGVYQHAVESLLDEVGIRGNFAHDAVPNDLWSLFAASWQEEVWRRTLGSVVFERLVQTRTLRPATLGAVVHPDHASSGRVLVVEQVDDTTVLGVSSDPVVPLRRLTNSDISGYELDLEAVAREVALAFGLEGTPSPLERGLWMLGTKVLTSSVQVAVVWGARVPVPTDTALIRSSAKGPHVVMLVPPGRAVAAEIPQVECKIPSDGYETVLPRVVERLNLQASVPPPLWIQEALILDAAHGCAWYRRTPLTKLRADTHPFKFAVAVAEAQGKPVSNGELSNLLSPSSLDNAVPKRAKRDFIEKVRSSFQEAEVPCPDDIHEIFESCSGGYRLKTSARVLR